LGCAAPRTTTRNKYTYACDTSAIAAAASVASQQGSAAGNSTRGIFALGNAGAASTTRNKYTYACDTSAIAAAASNASYWGAAASNGTTCVNV
jgi:hypothetical protein